jgi:hypothetical protein
VYVRSPESNLRVIAIGPGQFVRVDFDNAGEMEIQCQRGYDRWYTYGKSGFRELQSTTISSSDTMNTILVTPSKYFIDIMVHQ